METSEDGAANMTTSGTYNFSPGLGEITLYAYNLIGVRNTSVLQEHMISARMASNMLLSRWANQGVNLWAVDLQTVLFAQTPATTSASGTGTTATLTYATPNTPVYDVGSTITVSGMTPTGYNGTYTVTASSNGSVSYANATTGSQTVAGQITSSSYASTYSVAPNTVVMLDTYIETDNGNGQPIDRLILPVSRTEYASYPNKSQAGFSTTYWFDRLLSPTVTLWPVPNTGTSLKYYRVRQVQDSNLPNGQTVEIPYMWLEAFAYSLAQRLATIWAPDRVALLKPMADEAYAIAAAQNIETAQQYISPILSGYFR